MRTIDGTLLERIAATPNAAFISYAVRQLTHSSFQSATRKQDCCCSCCSGA